MSESIEQSLQTAVGLLRAGRAEDAIAACRTALRTHPDDTGLLRLLGVLLTQQHRHAEALACFEQALAQGELTPGDDAKLQLSRGLSLRALGRQDAALAAFDRALALAPEFPIARAERAGLLFDLGRHAEALPGLDIAAQQTPERADLAVARHFSAGMLCRWDARDEARLQAMLAQPTKDTVNPFPLVFFTEDPALQYRFAEQRATQVARANAIPLPPPAWPQPMQDRRIRVAYLSQDLRNHAVGHIMAEMFELHDRAKFDIRLLSTCRDDGSAIHQRYRAIDGFRDLSNLPPGQLGAAIREMQIDILVDMQGYTTGSFVHLLAQRLAPVQIDWIGFPGTMGAALNVDYIMADPHVIPPGAEQDYSEAVIRLPHCYQPNNRQRVIGETQPRSMYGLPDDAVVFACFNRPVKIRPAMFEAWMTILRNVPGSVLLLYAPEAEARDNLQQEATLRGIDPQRLHFAGTLPQEQYLARYRAVDLVLDTFPYGSHSTASDCLWAGTPLLALSGRTFASRVAGSILQAVGLGDLAMTRLEDYITTAIRLGNDRAALQALRKRLQDALPTAPLFDTPRMTRDVEAAYAAIWQRHCRGEKPRHITL